jgi:formate dehydrogenase alpha subunit
MGRVKNRVGQAALFKALSPAPLAASDSDHPFNLQVGPILRHNGSYTTWSENNQTVAGQPYVELYSADAAKAGISTGNAVKLTSGLGSITLPARVSDSLQPGLLFVPAHFREAQVNLLTRNAAGTVAVKLEKA